ncbi:response regulator [Candidatus Roizmanbacteria bacterium]|nr:response regulator [Candidatus Roizmanbacteria bacterium]
MADSKYTILVIEDEELLLNAIARKLQMSGMDVISCKSGRDGIDILTKSETLPDAIWLDFYLKDMDGFEFMNSLNKNDKWMHIPTVVVSNSASPERVTNMLSLGVKKYYLKAENRLDDIIVSVRNLIEEENKLKSTP